MDEIKADDISTYMRGRMGLLVGSEFTLGPGTMQELSTLLAGVFEVQGSGSPLDVADRCLSRGISDDTVRKAVRDFVKSAPRSPSVAHLAKAKWSTIISMSLDTHLEERLLSGRRNRAPHKTILGQSGRGLAARAWAVEPAWLRGRHV